MMIWLTDIFKVQKLVTIFIFTMLLSALFSTQIFAYDESKLPTCSKSLNRNERPMPYDRSKDSEVIANAKKDLEAAMAEFDKVCETLKKAYPSSKLDKSFLEGGDEYRERVNKIIAQNPNIEKMYKAAQKKYADTYSKYRTETALLVDKINKKDKEDGNILPVITTTGAAYAAQASKDDAEKYKNTQIRDKYTKEDQKTLENAGLYDPKNTFDGKCDIEAMRETYQSNCYSCIIVKTLIETFMSACAVAYDVTSEAGVKLLTLGALIWMAFFVMKNVSSLANVEPGAMVNTLAVFLFKVMVAYIFITSGLGVLVKYFVNPFLTAGADFGLALMATTGDISGAVNPEYAIKMATVTAEGGKAATEIVSADVINKIMLFTQSLDKTVSTHLVVGHAVTCHSMNAGAWDLKIIKLVNVWLWFCGALIWFVGFMLTLGICYYLLDISFKLGFAIMALPVVIGLWPFNITKGKVTAVFSIVLKSGATFAFLALTTTFALLLVSHALRDIPTLLDKIKNQETKWIADTFSITGPYFLIILFAYLYSMKLISATVDDYVNKFFGDNVFGKESPMHQMSTQMTDFAKDKVVGIGKGIGNKAGEALKEEAKEKIDTAKKFVKGLFKGKANGDTKSDKKGGSSGGAGGAVKGGGQAVKAGGATVEKTGQAVEQGGKAAEQGGKAAATGGKGMMKSGNSMISGGASMCGTGVGAIIGVPMMIAGAAVTAAGAGTYAAGKAVEVGGKVAQKAGKAMKKGGKAMKKVGEKMEKAGEKMEKVGNKLKFGDRKPAEGGENKPDDKPQPAPAEEPQPEPEPEPAPQPTPTPAPETPPAETK